MHISEKHSCSEGMTNTCGLTTLQSLLVLYLMSPCSPGQVWSNPLLLVHNGKCRKSLWHIAQPTPNAPLPKSICESCRSIITITSQGGAAPYIIIRWGSHIAQINICFYDRDYVSPVFSSLFPGSRVDLLGSTSWFLIPRATEAFLAFTFP